MNHNVYTWVTLIADSSRLSGLRKGREVRRVAVLVCVLQTWLMLGVAPTAAARAPKKAKYIKVANGAFRLQVRGKVLEVKRAGRRYHTFRFASPIETAHPNPRRPYVSLYFVQDGGNTRFVVIVDLRRRKAVPYRPLKVKFVGPPVYRRTSNPWSTRGSFIALPMTSAGPIAVISTPKIMSFLVGKARPHRFVQHKGGRLKLSQVHWLHRWKTDKVFLFDHACCGSAWRTRYNVRSRRYQGNRCVSGYCHRRRRVRGGGP
jgi:hypothetical protein